MFVIIEWNGIGAKGIMGLVLGKNGYPQVWYTKESAIRWAKKNCAFNYTIVEL